MVVSYFSRLDLNYLLDFSFRCQVSTMFSVEEFYQWLGL